MKTITLLTFIVTLMALPFAGKSTHIIGGTAAYQVIGISNDVATLQTSFLLYRDSNSPAQFDANIRVGLYGYVNGEHEYLSTSDVTLTFTEDIEFSNLGDCPEDMFSYSVGIYQFQVDVPSTGYQYYTLSYQRCCRDHTISNIQFPEETGIAITMNILPKAFEIQDPIVALKTSFPVWVNPGTPTTFDLFVDDGFEKSYNLSTPKAAGGVLGSVVQGDPSDCEGIIPDPANCPPEYADVTYVDPSNPYGSGSSLNLDSNSGILTAEIPTTGKVLVGYTVDRFFEDELFCRVRQQFVINSASCSPSSTEETVAEDFMIWPNPSNDVILFNEPLSQLSVFNIDGRRISNISFNSTTNQLSVDNLKQGTYVLKGFTKTQQLVVKPFVKI